MKQRLLVMNGQRIVQTEEGGAWTNEKVDKAGELKPGIYNLYMAQKVDKSERHEGMIVHTDKDSIYQKIGKNFVMHSRADFDKVPDVGSAKSITYSADGKAQASAASVTQSRSRSRDRFSG